MQAMAEELSALRGRMAEEEDELCSQVAMLREQLLSEQNQKDRLELSLTAELETVKMESGRSSVLVPSVHTLKSSPSQLNCST